MTGHLLVVDGDNLAHRLYHAVQDRPAHEAFGFALQRYIRQHRPTHVVIAFDSLIDGYSWRRELWPAYKPREPKPESLTSCLLDCRRECSAAGIAMVAPQSLADGLEADDLIGAYVEAAVCERMSVTIVSGDKDLTQLVRYEPEVWMVDEVRRLNWTALTVREKLGVDPERVPDLLALIGDKSDGYPGVPNIGPKTAVKLLADYGTLDGVLEHKNLVRSKRTMQLLREHEATARICYQLAKLRTDVALPVPLDECEVRR